MEVKKWSENRQLTVTLRGELDHHAARDVMEKMDHWMEQDLPRRTVLDLGELSFMDSSGIAVVLRARRRMEAMDGKLVVINIPSQAARVLEASGLIKQEKLV